MTRNLAERKRQKGAVNLTPFGEKVREIRKHREILLLDMAKIAEVSPGFLSMVETGRKQIPDDLVHKISSGLKLEHRLTIELQKAAALSAREYRLKLKENAGSLDRTLAFTMEKQFAKMTTLKKRKILELLNEE